MTIELSLYNPALTYFGQKQFDCGHAAINTFVHNSLKPQVRKNLSVAYVLTDAARCSAQNAVSVKTNLYPSYVATKMATCIKPPLQ